MTNLRAVTLIAIPFFSLSLFGACGDPTDGSEDMGGGGSTASGGTSSGGFGGVHLASGGGFDIGDLGGSGGGGMGGGMSVTIIEELPDGFTASEGGLGGAGGLRGGFRLVGPLADVDGTDSMECANILRVLVRDFTTYEHPAFGVEGSPVLGLVEAELGTDRKPVRTDVSPEAALQFEDWYSNIEGTNVPYVVDLWLEPEDEKFVFDSSRFFPLDSVAADDDKQGDDDGVLRNFGFTTELHTSFEYLGGESFTFRGDDDVWVFVDGQLAVDLGGLHGPTEGTVLIDDLGLTLHEVYDFDLFQAERCPTGSNFRLETTLDFTECGEILPGDIVK